MVRLFCVALMLSLGCQDAPLPVTAAPTFVTPVRATPMQRKHVQWRPGESLVWSVSFRGMQVGKAEMAVQGRDGDLRIESRFHTIGIAEQFFPLDHHLVTRESAQAQDLDDLHSALARVRTWASAEAAPATLRVRHGNRVYLLKLAQPVLDHSLSKPTLRIEGRAQTDSTPIELTLWLSNDRDHAPLQVMLVRNGKRVHAHLVERLSES